MQHGLNSFGYMHVPTMSGIIVILLPLAILPLMNLHGFGLMLHELWPGLEEIFYDNKHTLAVYLEEQFNNTRLDQFSNISDYCQQLKLLANQLANVDNSISKNKMVLQLVDGLPKGEYDSLATMIQ